MFLAARRPLAADRRRLLLPAQLSPSRLVHAAALAASRRLCGRRRCRQPLAVDAAIAVAAERAPCRRCSRACAK
jgi:hypothetical protein